MIDVAPATKAEMIAAFLAAEIDSNRWGARILALLHELRAHRRVIDTPKLGDETEDKIRRTVLARYRGYPDAFLFTRFPTSVKWRRVRLEPSDFRRMRYAREPATVPLAGPGRLVTDGARNFSAGVPGACGMAQIRAIVTAIKQGAALPPLVTVQDFDSSLIILEGNARATAYVIAGATGSGIEALVGSAPSFERWCYY